MTGQSLIKIANSFATAIRELKRHGVHDCKILERFAEYWVACKLTSKRHKVQILDEREATVADIFLPEDGIRVEVKSSAIREDGWAYASFGLGRQIKDSKFDYCVFLTFSDAGNAEPKDVLIFTRDELKEVAIPRRRLASHPDTNPCLLMYGGSLKEYTRQVENWRFKPFQIEMRLLTNPKQFRNNWAKIKGNNPSKSGVAPGILHLNLHRGGVAAIAAKTKCVEYRDRTPYWKKRLDGRHYDFILFRNGYATRAPEMRVEFRGLRQYGKGRNGHYGIRLGRIMNIKNWKP
jgi:hypothetical protein